MAVTTLFCYVQEDADLAVQLKNQLKLYEHNGHITILDCGDISAGAEREQQISTYLDQAPIILLLISPSFISSDFCFKEKMQQAIERHERKEARVIPIILRYIHWDMPPLHNLEPLPARGKAPIMKWRNREEAFHHVVEGLIKVVDQWNTHSLPDLTARRERFMSQLDQLIEAVKTHMQTPPRAMATASTLQQLSIFVPKDVTLADLIVGWQILAHTAKKDDDPPTTQRRKTCGELAALATAFTTEQGSLPQAIKTWETWANAFKKSDDPRQVTMSKTFARELAELQVATQ